MIPTDMGSNRKTRIQDIGCIQPAAETGFDHSHVGLRMMKVIQRQGCYEFKKGEFFFTRVFR